MTMTMSVETAKKATRVDVPRIIGKGEYYVLDKFARRDELCDAFAKAFLDGIEHLEGRACAERVAADGLSQVHEHFPAEKLHLLESHIMKRMREELYYWSYLIGKEDLRLGHPFYVDHLIVIRIHYPFLVARQAKDVAKKPVEFGERWKLAVATLKNPSMLVNYLVRHTSKPAGRDGKQSQYDATGYHGKLPRMARSHGPHIDTWYGHSYDGINLWLSIDGVNEDNTVILYPDMFGRPVDYDPVSMYLAQGIPLTRPVKVDLKPRELLVFNPELLHGTQVNISDQTRVALTTRLNPSTPRFNSNAPFNFEYWYSSEDLERWNFTSMSVFPAKKHHGEPSFEARPAAVAERTVKKTQAGRLSREAEVAVCDSAELQRGFKLAVDLENAKVLLWREDDGVRAYARQCPHLGIDLVDGYHDDARIYCPGHGISFALADGSSPCEAFRLRAYEAREANGKILLRVAG